MALSSNHARETGKKTIPLENIHEKEFFLQNQSYNAEQFEQV